MTRRLLISGHTPDELRIAIERDSILEGYHFEVADAGLTRGNIYRGVIASIEGSLNAAFIDYGGPRHGFLTCRDVVKEARYKTPKGRGSLRIGDLLERGQPVVAQVTRDPEGRKGAVLTTNLSLPGRYLVLTPFDDTRGVSRKVEDEESRSALKKVAAGLSLPEGCGLVVRTNARDQSQRELSRDLAALLRLWRRIYEEAQSGSEIRLLYGDQDLVLKVFRDHLDSSVDEILVDNQDLMRKAEQYLKAFLPRGTVKAQYYADRVPLFSRFDLEQQIESIYKRNVPLPSGGSIVIDPTEALTAIDVNSGSATQASSQAETALKINLEAATEVGRQLRLRDIGGLVVVDFIDLDKPEARRKVERAQRDALKDDKARSRISHISSNGLLEINRQRVGQSLTGRSFSECPTCRGRGLVPSPELASLQLLRRIEARVATGAMKAVVIRLHPEVADAFQNLRRREIARMEEEHGVRVEVKASPVLQRLDEDVQWTSLSKEEREAVRQMEPSVEAAELATPPGAAESPSPSASVPSPSAPASRPRRRRGGRRRAPRSRAAAKEE